MNIIQTPNEILNKKAEPVQKIDGKIRSLIDEMKETLRTSDIGVGLAAPQVGMALQLFVASEHLPDAKNKEELSILTCINPKIRSQSKLPLKKRQVDKRKLEGCLSIKDVWGPVTRSRNITIEYLDEHGKKNVRTFTGFTATIVQHEMDHLQGVLFTQRVLEQGNRLYREVPGKEKFEEIEI